jgi:16S rRNA (adenine1518-N6/adenine1519-N6)-dimethyltransferase
MSDQLPSTADLVKKYLIIAKKNLGQNFIYDQNITDKIVRSVGDLDDQYVLEIGPGPGSLTRSILKTKVKKLVVIEKDLRCIKILEEIKSFYGDRLEIINADALKIDEKNFFGENKFKIIANLPYNIGSLLLIKWLKNNQQISSMHLMLQKEVAQRIVANTKDRNYCRLSIISNFICQTKILFTVDRHVFSPPPKVTSAIVELIIKNNFDKKISLENLEKITATAFNQRRKMIKSSLKKLFGDKTLEILKNCNIKPDLRAENLTIEDYCNLSKTISISK